jgi:uncharacterized protein
LYVAVPIKKRDMLYQEMIKRCESFIAKISGAHDAGHDLTHIRRVRLNALEINREEKIADDGLIELCALFHDSIDHKFTKDVDASVEAINSFLGSEGINREDIARIIYVARNISFSQRAERGTLTPELAVVMDADRLDAMGAIGIARAFSYGGFRNRPMYGDDPKNSTIGHFYEKLLLLKELMNTSAGKKMALARHNFMITFLKEFERETGIEPATLSLGS